MTVKNRNASSTIFGFQFQINVAIYFMLHYLQNITKIKVEGEKEDVEIFLNNDKKWMIQAKSQTKNLYDNSKNSEKLKSALLSLAEADNKNVEYLFYASNMLNPLNTSSKEFERNDITILKYMELSPKSMKKIDHQIKQNIEATADNKKYDINKEKLVIIRIPFFGEFDSQKYKFIYEEANNVLGLISDTLIGKCKTIIKYCESEFLNNGAANPKMTITKEAFCNWIILIEVESLDLSNDHLNIGIEETDYYTAYQQYQHFIDLKSSSYENYGKVYSLYKTDLKKKNITISDFVKIEKIKLYNYFFEDDLKDESEITEKNRLDVYVDQIISYAILKKKSIIDKITKGANL